MFSTGNKFLSVLCAGVFALSAMADVTVVVKQPFLTTGDLAVDAYKANWSGNGTVKELETAPTVTVGKPIVEATDTNVLSVQGTVQCAASTGESKPATVDMMIQIAKPDDALELPSGEEKAQIAVGVAANGKLNVYCKNKQGNPGWYLLGDTVYAEGSWHRMSFTFDYGKGTCQISLDGVALVSANGYITADPAKSGENNGSWYKLNVATNQLATVKVIGSTAIDEMVVKYGETSAEVLPVLAGTTNGVPNAWLLAQGVADPTATAPDGSGLKVSEKYVAGMGVMDGNTYTISAMSMAGAAGSVKVTLAVPAMTPPAGRKNVIKYGTAPDSLNSTTNITAGAESVELSVSPAASGVTKIYYKMVNEAAQ